MKEIKSLVPLEQQETVALTISALTYGRDPKRVRSVPEKVVEIIHAEVPCPDKAEDYD
jgi:hypothetical protein